MTTVPRSARTSTSNPRPGSSVPWLLRRLNQHYRDATAGALAEAGFGDIPQRAYWALMALAAGAGDASEVVSQMGVTKQAVSKVVDILVASGYIDRRANPTDRRRTPLTLTAKGRKAVAVIERAVRATEQAFVAEVGTASFNRFTRTLRDLADEEK
jgi:DNA-binding MarR family transcriptional regulator